VVEQLLMDAANVIVEFKYAQGNAVGSASVTGCNCGPESVRIALTIATLNYLEGKGCDVSNVHVAFTL